MENEIYKNETAVTETSVGADDGQPIQKKMIM